MPQGKDQGKASEVNHVGQIFLNFKFKKIGDGDEGAHLSSGTVWKC